MDSVSQFVKKKIPLHQLNLDTYVSTENLSPDYGGVEQASKLPPNGSATEYKPDDILIANIRPYLKKVWRSNRSGGASNDVIVIRPKAALCKDYLPMVIANDAFINYVMKSAKGVKMPRGDIASVKKYIVLYPTPAEQQKIADCLSSLDGLIAAEGRALEALRDHKRGLMQQLFPQPGQSQPRLRFPEFRDKGEWEVRLLKNVVKNVKTGKLDANAMTEDGQYRYERFKDERHAAELAAVADKHGLTNEALQRFVGGILDRMIFDGEQLTDLMAPLDLGWRERREKELSLMDDLIPLLKKSADGRTISGLNAYEQ